MDKEKRTKRQTMVEKHRGGSFIGGGDRSARGKSPICRKSVANFKNTAMFELKPI
jgi:hypothetical protein